jgi:hypothetical protein
MGFILRFIQLWRVLVMPRSKLQPAWRVLLMLLVVHFIL